MERNRSIHTIRQGILWLENRAKIDKHPGRPENQEIYLTHEQLLVEMMKTKTVDEKPLTLKNLEAQHHENSYEQPSIFVGYHRKLKEFEENKEKRLRNRKKQMKENEEAFFKQAELALQINKKGIDQSINGDNEAAIDFFVEAYQSFPEVKIRDGMESNPAWLSICFNLGKALFNEGYLEDGFEYLMHYYTKTFEGNATRDALQHMFSIVEKYVDRRRVITATYDGINFFLDKEGISTKMDGINHFQLIDLSFKQPVSLQIEGRSKDHPELLDYFFLHKLYPSTETQTRYEILLPLNKVAVFRNEFYRTLSTNEHFITNMINDFNQLRTEYIVADIQERTRKFSDYPESYAQRFKSVLYVDVPTYLDESFNEEYRQFINSYVSNEVSDNEMDEEELLQLKGSLGELNGWLFSILEREHHDAQEHHRHVAELYADLKVMEQNFLQNDVMPFMIDRDSDYEGFKLEYLQLLDRVFDQKAFLKEREVYVEDVETILFQDKALEASINQHLLTIRQLIDVDVRSAIAKMRFVLEELLSHILDREGYSLYGEEYRLTSTQMILKIKSRIGEKLKDNMIQLQNKANSWSHYEAYEDDEKSQPWWKEKIISRI